jgi:hypothetical protein
MQCSVASANGCWTSAVCVNRVCVLVTERVGLTEWWSQSSTCAVRYAMARCTLVIRQR